MVGVSSGVLVVYAPNDTPNGVIFATTECYALKQKTP